MAAVVAEKEPHSPDRRCGSRSGSARYPSMSSMSFRRQAIRVTLSATHIWYAFSSTSHNSTCVFKSLIKFDGNLFFNRQPRTYPGLPAPVGRAVAGGRAHRGTGPRRGEDLREVVAWAARSRGPRRRPTSGWASLTRPRSRSPHWPPRASPTRELLSASSSAAPPSKTHLEHIYAKLHIAGRTELARAHADRP